MGESYGSFARVYDELMDNVPYGDWAAFLMDTLKSYGICPAGRNFSDGNIDSDYAAEGEARKKSEENGTVQEKGSLEQNLAVERNTVLDLGCGTGTLTELLSQAGFDMIGIDHSEEMLEIAMEKREKSSSDILYLQQDMREFELFGTVGAVYSVCDSLNYILEDTDMLQVFSLVNNYLYPGGIFIFDFNTVYKYEQVIGDTTIAENREDCSFIWENWYHEEEQVNEYDLTIFVKEKAACGDDGVKEKAACGDDEVEGKAVCGDGALYRRFSETHYQRGYTLSQMQEFLKQSGLIFLRALDADTHGEVQEKSERIYIIAREQGKNEKLK